MRKIILASVVILFISATRNIPHNIGTTLVKLEVIKDVLSSTTIDEPELTAMLGRMKPDGSWPDIDYTDQTRGAWPPNDHLVRLNNLAVMYTRKKGDEALKNKILLGLDYWFKNDFICPNWWYPQIGVPKVLGPTMLLMEKDLSADQKAAGLKILDRAKIGMTGQNKVWLSGNVIYKGLLIDSFEMVKAAVDAIQSEIVISQGEGIQPDYSFHQHGPQQQFGNYGASFAADMLKWASILKPTDFRFPEWRIQIIRDYLLNGMKWIVWNNQMDISACGRQLFPGSQIGKAKMIEDIFSNMATIDPLLKTEYEKSMQNFEGDKFFWRSDMVIHRKKAFYTSVRMCSSRVGGAESCNDENISGYHLADGANYFYQSGNEYTDIFPFWDWKRIPGTTTFHDAAPLPILSCSGYRINSDFVGGTQEVATMLYNRDSLVAQKSWFFFDDVTVCLGAGIHSKEDKEVTTTINQSFLHGDVRFNDGTSTQVLKTGIHTLDKVSWITHDNWAYVFPQKISVELSNRMQNGDWHNVLKRMPSKEMKADIFTLGINHHKKPIDATYAYFVLPAANADSINVKTNPIRIIENSPAIQAVENVQTGVVSIVFFKAGMVKSKSLGTISAAQPCVITVGRDTDISLVYSDPSHAQMIGSVTIEGAKSPGNNDKTKSSKTISLTFPQGAGAGGAVTTVSGIGTKPKTAITGD